MELKNKKIDLFGTTYTIKIVDKIELEENGIISEPSGLTNFVEHTIQVARTSHDVEIPEQEMKITLLHELFHAILKSGQYNSCADDEPLVEWLARCIYKCLNNKVI